MIEYVMRAMVIVFTGLTFIVYGLLCLLTDHMVTEFTRYGLSRFRKLTGILELLGGLGLIVGLFYPPILFLSSLGLSVLMFLGVLVRLKTRDPLIEIFPAFTLKKVPRSFSHEICEKK